MVKNPPANAVDIGSIPGLERSPGEGNDNPLQHSCLGNPMDIGAWWAADRGAAKSQTGLSPKDAHGMFYLHWLIFPFPRNL